MREFSITKYNVFGTWVATHQFLPATNATVEIMTSGGDFLLARCFYGVWYVPLPGGQWRRSESYIVSWKPGAEDDKRPKQTGATNERLYGS